MKKNQLEKERVRLLTDMMIRNATYLGLSKSTIQYMITSALESLPGIMLTMKYKARHVEDHRSEIRHSDDNRLPDINMCKHAEMMPHKPLPNVTKYEHDASGYDVLGALQGRMLRRDKGQHYITNGALVRANRYITYRIAQLGHYRDRGQKGYYWRHGLELMSNKVFQEMAFNHVCHNWHLEYSQKEVNSILHEVGLLVKEVETEMKVRRVYIPKPNKKWRPLGVPTKSWRVYLHMWNVLAVWFRAGQDRNQHAYFPNRGIDTAWLALLKKIEQPHIYEFDLQSFFPSVTLDGNYEIMTKELGFPIEIAKILKKLNQSITKLEKTDLLPEDYDRKVLLNSSGAPNPNLPTETQKLIRNLLEPLDEEYKARLLDSPELRSVLPAGWTVYKEVGMPQGAATSCGLSTLNLHYLWRRHKDRLLMYADDGLVFPTTCTTPPDICDAERGVKENEEKSGWVKKDGIFLKALKFLGCEFIPASGEEVAKIRAKTRNGSTKEYTIDSQVLVHLMNERDLMLWLTNEEPECPGGDDDVVWISEKRPDVLVKEVVYNGNHSKNGWARSTTEHSGKLLKEVKETLLSNSTMAEWLTKAGDRLCELNNPLKYLFQGKGLAVLSEMFAPESKVIYDQSKSIKCRKGSWSHQSLGRVIYQTFFDEYFPNYLKRNYIFINITDSEESAKIEKIKSSHLEIWRSLFRIRGVDGPKIIKEEWAGIRQDMKGYIRSLSLNIQNLSTYACLDLLKSKLRLPTDSDIIFCKVQRVITRKIPAKEQSLLERQAKKKAEREFKRQYGKWIRKLERPPNSRLTNTCKEANTSAQKDVMY